MCGIMMCGTMLRSTLMLASVAVFLPRSAVAAERTFTIEEPFGVSWGPDRVSYVVEFEKGKAVPDGIGLKDGQGRPVAVQLSDLELWPDQTLRRATLSLLVTLKPNEKAAWSLIAGTNRLDQPHSNLTTKKNGDSIELSNSKTAIRLIGGKRTFDPPVAAEQIPAPIQGVRLPSGRWIGKGWWQTDVKCTGYCAEVLEAGPVFVRAKLRYDFEGGKSYAATVELSAGQDLAVVTEEFNLSEGQGYRMTGVDGMKPDEKYAYIYPEFDPPQKALIWDWWGQTHAVLPTPNAYFFDFHEGLRPDSAEFHGRSQYGNLKAGDGGLTYDKDGRFAYVNAYLQWGDEETLYLGLYNSKDPAPMLAVAALRPSRWLHPDIDPHPNTILQQYTQTACLTFERRTSGKVWMRAPVCLGRRVYGIGGMRRTLARHVLPERSGPKLSEKEIWGSELMLRHVRLGRLELNTVKDWVLAYDEPSEYPRLYVPPGDRARYESRKTRKPPAEVQRELASRQESTEAEKKAVDEAIARLKHLVLHFVQTNKGHMDFGIEEGLLADAAEDALASAACTPQQAQQIRHWIAAIVYFSLHPDFVPPRQAGFAWGSANMMAQVQCRACPLAALLPNHPAGQSWRRQLAKVVTLYVENQINEAGATLECPHYGGMAVTMPVHALAALAGCGDVDLARAEKRLRAAAHHRLATLLPPDVRGGFRSQTPQGDGYYDGEGTFAPLAGFFQQRDPQLARQLAWGVQQSGNVLGGHSDPSYKLFDVGLEPLVPKLASEHFPGYGFVMRHGFPRADEAYLQVYAGSFCWGHGHNDRGCWVMYAKGAPLMTDFAAMYTPSMREQWLHPGGLTFDHDDAVRPATDDPKNDWWRKSQNATYRALQKAPFTAVEMRPHPNPQGNLDHMGEVTSFQTAPQADFAEMRRRISYLHRVPFTLKDVHGQDLFDDGPHEEIWLKRPFIWRRRFVFVKDADPQGHNYLVIRDDLSGNGELDPYLNLWCLADRLDVRGQTAVYAGQHGIDLHCYMAQPARFTARTRTVGHGNGFGFVHHYRRAFHKDFREDQIQLQIPQTKRDEGYFVAMVPVKQGEAAPKFETLAAGKALRVTFPDRVDTIILQSDPGIVQIERQNTSAASALLLKRNGKTEIVNFD